MTRADRTLARMRANPRDWRIGDVEAVCRRHGLVVTPPKRGSHYKVRHPGAPDILTIPADRPVKPVYIRKLVELIDATQGKGHEDPR